ncbi:hypothetical protein ERN12_08010 [Rhodobacteraceae bacterium]|nr:hypothetical protein ERN12_08010 [Paracoccaceae bacterium]
MSWAYSLGTRTLKQPVKTTLGEDASLPVDPNDVRAMDIGYDQRALGKTFRILTILDTHTRLCPASDPRFSYRDKYIVQRLERV